MVVATSEMISWKLLSKNKKMKSSASTFRYQVKPTIKRGTLLTVLLVYAGLQIVMAFCPGQFSGIGEMSQIYRIADCSFNSNSEIKHYWFKKANNRDIHCLDIQDPSNSPLQSKSVVATQNSEFVTEAAVDFEGIRSFSKFTGLLKRLPLNNISNTLLSQKTSFLFYH